MEFIFLLSTLALFFGLLTGGLFLIDLLVSCFYGKRLKQQSRKAGLLSVAALGLAVIGYILFMQLVLK